MNSLDLKNSPKDLFCKNHKCGMSFTCSSETAYAMIEYLNSEKLNSTLDFICDSCHNVSKFSYIEILNSLPYNKRPKNLPPDEVFVLFLIPIKTEQPMDNPAFGEFVRAKVLQRDEDTFFCKLTEKSLISPTLTYNDVIHCRVVSGYIYAFDKLVKDNFGERWEPIQKEAPPKNSIIGLFFVKEDTSSNELIIPANPKCSNPSCNYIYSYTASKLTYLLKTNPEKLIDFHKKYILIECPKCTSNKIITEEFIKTLYPF